MTGRSGKLQPEREPDSVRVMTLCLHRGIGEAVQAQCLRRFLPSSINHMVLLISGRTCQLTSWCSSWLGSMHVSRKVGWSPLSRTRSTQHALCQDLTEVAQPRHRQFMLPNQMSLLSEGHQSPTPHPLRSSNVLVPKRQPYQLHDEDGATTVTTPLPHLPGSDQRCIA
jgi:hypothetical protein